MKKLISTMLVVLTLFTSGILLAACPNDVSKAEMPVGKYYAYNNDDSYVEILSEQKVRFVNVDFTYVEESINEVDPNTFANVGVNERIGSEVHKYIPMADAQKNVHFYVDIPDSAYALRIYIEDNIITLGDVWFILPFEEY